MTDPATDEHLHPAVRGGIALWTLLLGFTMLMVGNGLNVAVLGVCRCRLVLPRLPVASPRSRAVVDPTVVWSLSEFSQHRRPS